MRKGKKRENGSHLHKKGLFLLCELIASFSLSSCKLDGFFTIIPSSSSPSSNPSNSSSPSSSELSSSSSESSSSSNPSNSSSSSSSEPSSSSSGSSPLYDEISFHFLTLGNKYNGDSIYIKAGDNDILIDAGSRSSSASTIKNYVDKYCTDGKLEYVIATHSDQDHIASFAFSTSLFKQYEVGTLIDFPLSNSGSKTYLSYCENRDYLLQQGTLHYTAKQCYYETDGAKASYTLGNGLSMSVLYQKYYDTLDTSCENNQSVCLLFKQGEKKMLFTGDLEESGCESLLANNDIGTVDLYKGGHHGSVNANADSFISAIRPATICTFCVAGSNEYTQNNANTMPYQTTIDNWAKWTDEVYITTQAVSTGVKGSIGEISDLNGNIEVKYDQTGKKSVSGSANSKKLKDSDWMKKNRTMPDNWK